MKGNMYVYLLPGKVIQIFQRTRPKIQKTVSRHHVIYIKEKKDEQDTGLDFKNAMYDIQTRLETMSLPEGFIEELNK